MKKIFTAVTILVTIAITETYLKQQVEKPVTGQKVIRQSPRTSVRILKP